MPGRQGPGEEEMEDRRVGERVGLGDREWQQLEEQSRTRESLARRLAMENLKSLGSFTVV